MKKILLPTLIAALLAGCSNLRLGGFTTTTPFTQDLRETYAITPEQITKLQFYTSDEIVLERLLHKQSAEASKENRLTLVNNDVVRRVRIPADTPCVAVAVTNDMIEVSFEQGKTLHFGSSPAKRKETKGVYSLLARDWTERRGTVSYGGETYTTEAGAGQVHLVVKADDVRAFRVVGRTVKGVTVADREFAEYYKTIVTPATNAPTAVPPTAK
jgi:hypothetical protein